MKPLRPLLHKLIAPLTAMFFTSPVLAQEFVIERQDKTNWIEVARNVSGEINPIYTLGTVTAGTRLDVNYRIRSLQEFANINLQSITTSSGTSEITVVDIGPSLLMPGEIDPFIIRYIPTSPSESTTVTFSGTGSPLLPFSFTVRGVARDSVAQFSRVAAGVNPIVADNAPASVANGTDFGARGVGGGTIPQTIVTRTFALSNAPGADGPLGFRNIRLGGTGKSDYTISGIPASGTVAAGASQTMTIAFNPSALGTRSALLQIDTTDGALGTNGTYDIPLSGAGTTTFSAQVKASANVSPRNFMTIANGDATPTIPKGTLMVSTNAGASNATYLSFQNPGDVDFDKATVTVEPISGRTAFTLLDPLLVGAGGLNTWTFDLKSGDSKAFTLFFAPVDGGVTRSRIVFRPSDDPSQSHSFIVEGTGLGPEIEVTAQGITLRTNSANSPLTSTSTVFTALINGRRTQDYVLTNVGNSPLSVTNGFFQGLDGPFEVSGLSSTNVVVPPSGTIPFSISYRPTNANDTTTRVFEIRSNDANDANHTFTVRGNAVGTPQLRVKGVFNGSVIPYEIDDTPLLPDQNITNYGGYAQSTPPFSRRFRVLNDGTATLSLTGPITTSNPAWTITAQSLSQAVVGSEFDFRVLFTPNSPGIGNVGIVSIPTNDPAVPIYRFALTADVYLPKVDVYGGDNKDVLIVPGLRTASALDGTAFPNVVPGSGSFVREFSLKNNGTAAYRLSEIFSMPLDGGPRHFFPVFDYTNVPTLEPGESLTFSVGFNPQGAGVFDSAITLIGNRNADGIAQEATSFYVTGTGTGPGTLPVLEVRPVISANGILGSPIANGAVPTATARTDFGSPSALFTRTFNLKNAGTVLPLNFSSGPPTAGQGFSISLGTSTLTAGDTTQFLVTFDPARPAGTYNAAITLTTNDPANPSYVMNVRATVVATVPPKILSIVRIGNELEFDLVLPAGVSGNLQASPNLQAPWVNVGNISSSGLFRVSTNFLTLPKRYFRLVIP